MGILKTGKIAILIAGRHAGKKAIIVKVFENGSKERPFSHCLVAGIERYPRKVTKSMSRKKVLKRSKVKPFVKYVNCQHIMPTRYGIDIEARSVVSVSSMSSTEKRKECRKEFKNLMEKKYLSSGHSTTRWFFSPLRF